VNGQETEVSTLDDWAQFIWDNLLEGVEGNEGLRFLPCGCIVRNDDSVYLDLYSFNEGWAGRSCEDQAAHQVIWRMIHLAKALDDFYAPLPDAEREELVRLVREYTDGWGEQKDILRKIGVEEVVHQ
jgi:hypothetical protein